MKFKSNGIISLSEQPITTGKKTLLHHHYVLSYSFLACLSKLCSNDISWCDNNFVFYFSLRMKLILEWGLCSSGTRCCVTG